MAEASELEQARIESGVGHRDENFNKLSLQRELPPRCAKCKRWMGYNDGMYIIISGDWRVHIRCFATILERNFKNGEAIDLSTGNIIEVDTLENKEVDDS
jgi:hypothetical protein